MRASRRRYLPQARRMGWTGVVLYTGTLATLILIVALLLIRIPPLPGNLLRPEGEPDGLTCVGIMTGDGSRSKDGQTRFDRGKK